MKKSVKSSPLLGLFATITASAATFSEDVYWYDGDNAGQKAATCTYHIPDKHPFSDAVTLVVNNAKAVGTVLWSWDYATFLPDYTFSCTGSGISNSSNRLRDQGRANPNNWQLRLTAQGGNDLMPTSNPGAGIRWYFRTPYGEEVKSEAQKSVSISLETSESELGRYVFNPGKSLAISAKAELVKTGEVVYGTAISPKIAQSQLWLETGSTRKSIDTLGQGGIIPVAPACRLATKDYHVDMGRWVTQTDSHLPARSPETRFELQLECTGEVTHLRLRFEDVGKRSSANRNVTLYRAPEGETIEGLEVEMLFDGKQISIGDTEYFDAGARGRSIQRATPGYDATTPVALTARYVQYSLITSGASLYTGNVRGSVNLWMTYD